MPSGAVWNELVDVARWSPSPHNVQPWRVRAIDHQQAELYVDRRRMLPDEDTTGSFIGCAMGMFVEALSIAAAHRDLRLQAQLVEGPERDGLVPYATLLLSSDPPGREEIEPRDILERRTSRLPAVGEPVGESDLRELAKVAAAGGQTLTWTSDPPVIAQIMTANLDAVSEDMNDPRYHDEIAGWFRYGPRHAARCRDGLASTCMNMPAHELWITAKMPWLLRARLTRGAMRMQYTRRLGPVRQLGFVSGPFFAPPGAGYPAGRTLLRLWLHMHRRGIGIHPFGNLVTNPAAHRRLTELAGRDRIWLVFRLGRTPIPTRSERLPTEALMC